MSSNIKVQRICKYCGNEFTAKTTVTLYCGETCSKRAYKARLRATKVESANAETQQILTKPLEELKAKAYLSISDTCNLVGISRRTIYRMIERGELIVGKAGKRTIIRRSDLDLLFAPPRLVDDQPDFKAESMQYKISDCYSLNEIRSKFGISDKALYDLIKRNNIHKIRHGIYTYVNKQAIDLILC